jgi:hypothetical protein
MGGPPAIHFELLLSPAIPRQTLGLSICFPKGAFFATVKSLWQEFLPLVMRNGSVLVCIKEEPLGAVSKGSPEPYSLGNILRAFDFIGYFQSCPARYSCWFSRSRNQVKSVVNTHGYRCFVPKTLGKAIHLDTRGIANQKVTRRFCPAVSLVALDLSQRPSDSIQ